MTASKSGSSSLSNRGIHFCLPSNPVVTSSSGTECGFISWFFNHSGLATSAALLSQAGADSPAEVESAGLQGVTGPTPVGHDDLLGSLFLCAAEIAPGSGFLAPSGDQRKKGQSSGALQRTENPFDGRDRTDPRHRD